MLSHELRNPLAAILSATRVLESASVDATTRARRPGQVVERQANHMARLLDDLLDVSRITRGRIVLRKERVDLRDTARSAIEALGPLMAEREHAPDRPRSRDEPVPVFGDPARLQQMQANLLSNASKYSPRRRRASGSSCAASDGQAIIRVSDDGPRHRAASMLPRIFDLFVQGDQSLDAIRGRPRHRPDAAAFAGRAARRTRRGRQRRAGRGSVFTVWLPLAPTARPTADDGAGRRGRRSGRSCWSRIRPTRAG